MKGPLLVADVSAVTLHLTSSRKMHEHRFTWLASRNSASEKPISWLQTEASRYKVVVYQQIAGFLPRDPHWAESIARSTSAIPVIVIHGEADALIPMNRSEDLQTALQKGNSCVKRMSHPGAHMVPSCSHDFKQELQSFLDTIWATAAVYCSQEIFTSFNMTELLNSQGWQQMCKAYSSYSSWT